MLRLLVFLASIASAAISLDAAHPGYEWLFLHPLIFVICFNIIYRKNQPYEQRSIFLQSIGIIAFLRYVCLPTVTVIADSYEGRSRISPFATSFHSAIFLMAYELIAVTVAINFLERRKSKTNNHTVSIKNSKSLPVSYHLSVFLISMLLVIQVAPKTLTLISIFTPSDAIASGTEFSAIQLAAAYFLVASKTLLAISVLSYIGNKQYREPSFSPPLIGAIAVLGNTAIYFLTSRITILINFIISTIFYHAIFGREHSNKTIPLTIGSVAAVVLVITSLTAAREHAITLSNPIELTADALQVYCGGTYNVAIGLEVDDRYPEAGKIEVFLYDILRSTIGTNMLVKDWQMTYSNDYFNQRMWTHVDRRSQIMPMIAQGEMFFGPALSPLPSILFVLLAYLFEQTASSTNSVELKFCLALLACRLGLIFGQNTMNMCNYISLNLFFTVAILGIGTALYSARRE